MASTSQRDTDPHEQAVYRWENTWPGWDRNHLNIGQCRALIKIVCDHYKVECPDVAQHERGYLAWSRPWDNKLSVQGGKHMRQGGLNVSTVLHEAAHHVAWHLYKGRAQYHGRAFLGVFIECLVKAKVAPRIALEASARAFGLKWTYPKIDRVRPRAAR